MTNKPGYYAIIPSVVRYDNRLKPNEKLLYGEITALANKLGVCFAENQYFADLYEKDKATISRWISNLKKCGYIQVHVKYKKGTKEIEKRGIIINGTFENNNFKYFQVNKGRASIPDWFGKEIEEDRATEEEIRELNELLGTD